MTPRALGGSGDAENLRVRCRAHNRDAAERVFGRAHVEERIRTYRERSSRRSDRGAPSAGPPDFSQRKCEGARAAAAMASSAAIRGPALEANHVASEQARDDDARKLVRAALLTLN
ncbi:hypothetical protein AKJ09_11075 [Labilithrix luteola]|uniref:Uncharacterized protein n=1 Tax=Labilithrix luteola TaxID=1391654 RepID=A0A0K1QFI5_9BACT|nr:hypothetical protein AKJ09_11075 [Labilithrix luteola]